MRVFLFLMLAVKNSMNRQAACSPARAIRCRQPVEACELAGWNWNKILGHFKIRKSTDRLDG